jgi:4-hydroxy-3-polyprenylbenzoate decarboxylase
MRYVVAITGASGTIYGIRLLEELPGEKECIISDNGLKIMEYETGKSIDYLEKLAKVYRENELDSPIASGSHHFDAMIIAPASMNTVGKIANGISDNLITRAASVALKERRRLILVPRESPMSSIHLRNLTTLAEIGADIVLPSPAFYNHPKSVDDMVNFVVGRVLDLLGIEHELYERWENKG